MKGIIAINNIGFIGKDGVLPWDCPEDLQHFKKLTMDCTVLVGFNTFKTLPYLKGRTKILDERGKFLKADWCIGGKKTFEKYCKVFTELHISYIDDDTIGDTMMPDLSKLNPFCKIYKYYFKSK